MIILKALIFTAIVSAIIVFGGTIVFVVTDETINYNNNTKKGDIKHVKKKASKTKHR